MRDQDDPHHPSGGAEITSRAPAVAELDRTWNEAIETAALGVGRFMSGNELSKVVVQVIRSYKRAGDRESAAGRAGDGQAPAPQSPDGSPDRGGAPA